MKNLMKIKGIRKHAPTHLKRGLIRNYKMPNVQIRRIPLLKNWLPMKFRTISKNTTKKRQKKKNIQKSRRKSRRNSHKKSRKNKH